MTNHQKVTQLVRKWQKKLRLLDWEVRILLAKEAHAQNPNREADVGTDAESRRATITFYPCSFEDDWSLERTVIHELLHLYWALFGFEVGTAQGNLEENAVYAISDAIADILKKQR